MVKLVIIPPSVMCTTSMISNLSSKCRFKTHIDEKKIKKSLIEFVETNHETFGGSMDDFALGRDEIADEIAKVNFPIYDTFVNNGGKLGDFENTDDMHHLIGEIIEKQFYIG